MKYKGLIFLDIDGTLLKPDYRPNTNSLPRYIEKLSQQGYLFCLNSNRSENDLKPLIKQFQINGPVIAENGTFFLFKKKKQSLLLLKPLAQKLGKLLQDLAVHTGAYVEFRDTVNYSWNELNSKPLAWIANQFRQYTASIHVRAFGKKDLVAAKKLVQKLKKALGKQYSVQISSIFCNVLISPKKVDKGTAITAIRKKFSIHTPAAMIGDDLADLPTLASIDAFYAVGNAEPDLKKRALFVAKKPYTQGVVEILKHIDRYGIPGRSL